MNSPVTHLDPAAQHPPFFSTTSLPLLVSPPVLWVFKQTVQAIGGAFTFTGAKLAFSPPILLQSLSVYYLKSLTFFADVASEDYSGAIDVTPVFHIYMPQEAGATFMQQGTPLGGYIQNLPFEYMYQPTQDNNPVTGALTGKVNKTASLAGKSALTMTVIVAVQEIRDQGYANAVKAGYPT